MNKDELKAQIVRKNRTANQLCSAIGISRTAWFRKLNGKSQFTLKEIINIREELDLDDKQTNIIFFNKEVS